MRLLPLLLALGAALPASGQTEAPDLRALLIRVKGEEDKVPAQVFARISSVQSDEAYKTLRTAVGYLRSEARLNSCYGAFTGFAKTPRLSQLSVDFLRGEAKGHNRDENQRAATRALARFGKPAFPALEALLARHREEAVRRIAAQPLIPRLGEIGNKKAAETILAYAQLSSGTKEQVIFQALRRCEGSKVDALLATRLLDQKTPERWRALLLSVLGAREGRGIAKSLVSALGDPSPDIRTTVLEILGDRNERGALKQVRRFLTSKHEGELRQAIVTATRLSGGDEDWEEDLLEFARDARPAARMGAALGLLELRTVPAVDALHRLLADTDWRVRVEALQQVANLRRVRTVPYLIERLDQERGRLRRDVALVLRLMTGLDHGTNAARWRGWWTAEAEGFRLPTYEVALVAEGERAERRRTNQTTATFYGLEIVSDRVAFVIDTSGSMASKAGSKGRTSTQGGKNTGPTRLAVAKQELTGALRSISPGVMFNLVFFSSGVSPWQDELLAKDEEVQAEAFEFTERQVARGATNIYDAMIVALEDRRVDTIYLLSDGDPTAGQVVDPTLILERMAKLNRVRKVQIHCISIGKASGFMRRLAEQNGGTYKESR
jgi:HEAT repeat protein